MVTAVVVLGLVVSATACAGGDDDASGTTTEQPNDVTAETTTTRAPDAPLPTVVPTPRQMSWLGADATVTRTVALVADDGTDAPTRTLLGEVLDQAGARRVTDAPPGDDDGDGGSSRRRLVVRAGIVGAGTEGGGSPVEEALRDAGVDPPPELGAEGYALAVTPGSIVLAGADAAGLHYAAQTLRQLVQGDTVAGVSVVDQPAMAHRGVVEGFYGSPWTLDERLDQLAFYGEMKLNTYIYAPKDDPYHRDRWREPYPPELLDGLRRLIDAARDHHVRFTFAVSPGVSICYSDPAEVDALAAKLTAVYDQGVRDVAVALDDIDHRRWNCDADHARYGPPSDETAARAHAELLNTLQQSFVATHQGTRPLVLVPTDYRGTGDSAYTRTLRQHLDPAVEVMWTGAHVVPAEITAEQAAAGQARYGRPVFLWDNYPVNDYPRTAGRLLLAPYARRAGDLDRHVTGVAANPMNQAAASKVALVGVADFTWNPGAYDPARAHRAAAEHLAGARRTGAGAAADQATVGPTVEALLAFFDLEHFVPTSAASASVIGQPQAPVLAGRLDAFRERWGSGDRSGALAELRPYAELLAAAPDRIRRGVTDPGFAADCGPWLDALALWGRAFVASLDGLAARVSGDEATAQARFGEAMALTAQAGAIHTIPGETLPQGPVKLGDGVLDTFLADAPTLT